MPHILMCPPDYFGVHYEINPWMHTDRRVDAERAVRQWNALRQLLAGLGAQISLLEPVAQLPDLVFTANAGLVYGNTVVLSRFRHPQRQGEELHDRVWFRARGYDVIDAPEGQAFEGAGDALFCGDTLFAGYRIRSDAAGQQQIGAILGVRVLPLELVDPSYYHLDTCFCPLTTSAAIYYPAAFDDYGRRALADAIPTLIPVEQAEAAAFACNAVVVGQHVITNVGCSELHHRLGERGFATHATPLGEFLKAGGSAKCLTLRLDGEEAAGWAHSEAPPINVDHPSA